MKKTLMVTALVGMTAGALSGCGSQAGPAYEGEPLLSFGAKVVVQNADAPANLVPAVAFVAEHEGSDAIYVQEVAYAGTFPRAVQLSLFEPPPPNAMVRLDGESEDKLPDEPAVAQGFVTAVEPGRSPYLPFDNELSDLQCNPAPDAPQPSCVQRDGRCPRQVTQLDPEQCYVEETLCDTNRGTCEYSRSYGNEEYATPLPRRFAGLSRNVAIVYLDAPAAKSSLVSYMYNQGRAMKAGYSLLKWEPASDEDKRAADACVDEAHAAFLTDYNAEHGTDFVEVNDLPFGWELWRDMARATDERGCLGITVGGYVQAVDVKTEPRITIEIGVDWEGPFDAFGERQRESSACPGAPDGC